LKADPATREIPVVVVTSKDLNGEERGRLAPHEGEGLSKAAAAARHAPRPPPCAPPWPGAGPADGGAGPGVDHRVAERRRQRRQPLRAKPDLPAGRPRPGGGARRPASPAPRAADWPRERR